MRKLHDFEVTRVAAQATVKRETVRKFFTDPDRMQPSTRARVEKALRELGFLVGPAQPAQAATSPMRERGR